MANRVDSKMVELGLAQSRERARALIIEGVVLLDGVRVMKPSDTIRDGQILSLKENPIPFVSRGGLKLQKAIDTYQISLKDRVCVDIGASTGGFTDCMLMHGAKKVFARCPNKDGVGLAVYNRILRAATPTYAYRLRGGSFLLHWQTPNTKP